MTVRKLLAERLKETQHSSAELAEALEVPGHYVTELMPRPDRSL
jgi:plasmid maintenance system antidote protein VapI